MTKDERAEIRARCEAATKGPWIRGFSDGSGVECDEDHGAYICPDLLDHPVVSGGSYEGIPKGVILSDDVEFIIHAREDIPALLDALDEAEAELADWREASRKVLDDKCPSDEHHCTCVPLLRKRIAELEAEEVWIVCPLCLSDILTMNANGVCLMCHGAGKTKATRAK